MLNDTSFVLRNVSINLPPSVQSCDAPIASVNRPTPQPTPEAVSCNERASTATVNGQHERKKAQIDYLDLRHRARWGGWQPYSPRPSPHCAHLGCGCYLGCIPFLFALSFIFFCTWSLVFSDFIFLFTLIEFGSIERGGLTFRPLF